MADLFRRHGAAYTKRFGDRRLPSHRRAMRDRIECRTAVLGGHLFACTHCDHPPYAYPSCRNRSCPKCHGRDIEAWRAARHSELLPVEYFHVVFTVPAELREAARRHPKTVYDVLMKASASALTTLAADPHYVGGRIGVLAVLHTWTRTLTYHPHVHCLVPGGGLSSDGQWRSARPGFLRPVRALSRLFRGRFRALLTRALPDLEVPASAWKKEWVVYAKPSVQGVDAVLNYLGRYVHRIAITNNRILAIEDGRVTFRYPWCGQTRGQTMTLDAHEFIRRFLPHVLPKGTHKVRYHGLWAPANRRVLHALQIRLATDRPTPLVEEPGVAVSDDPGHTAEPLPCPQCPQGMLVLIRRIPRQNRAPPRPANAPSHLAPVSPCPPC